MLDPIRQGARATGDERQAISERLQQAEAEPRPARRHDQEVGITVVAIDLVRRRPAVVVDVLGEGEVLLMIAQHPVTDQMEAEASRRQAIETAHGIAEDVDALLSMEVADEEHVDDGGIGEYERSSMGQLSSTLFSINTQREEKPKALL